MDDVRRGARAGENTSGFAALGAVATALIVAACLALLAGAGGAAAKSGSTPIPTPAPTTQVLSVSLAGESYDYTWADVSGVGTLGGTVTQSYLLETPQDWTGIWLRRVLGDVETRSGITLDGDWRLRVSTVDAYGAGLFVGDVQDAANNFLLAMDPVRGCNTEGPAEATVWYDPSYVRVCTNGDYGNTAFPARLVSTTGSMTVLDAGGHEIDAPETASLVVTSPTVSQKRASVPKGKRLALRAVATRAPTAPAAQAVAWSSGDAVVATVAQTGAVTAKKTGTVVITATSGKHAASFTVKVVSRAVNATRVTLPKTKAVSVGAGARLTARLYPSGATSTVSWRSSNSKVATVDRTGLVTGLRKGRATVTVRTSNGKTATCAVTVR
jgi:hypothetical protein